MTCLVLPRVTLHNTINAVKAQKEMAILRKLVQSLKKNAIVHQSVLSNRQSSSIDLLSSENDYPAARICWIPHRIRCQNVLPSGPPTQPEGSSVFGSSSFKSIGGLIAGKAALSCPKPTSRPAVASVSAAMTSGCNSWAWDGQHETFLTFLECVANRELAPKCGGFPKLVGRRGVEWRLLDCWILFWRNSKVLRGKCHAIYEFA